MFKRLLIKTVAHPICFTYSYFVPRVGFEPTTHGLEIRCSVQLSYRGKLTTCNQMCIRLPPLTFIFATNPATISHIINLQFYYTGILYFAILFVSYVYYWVLSSTAISDCFIYWLFIKKSFQPYCKLDINITTLGYPEVIFLHLKYSTSCAIRILYNG